MRINGLSLVIALLLIGQATAYGQPTTPVVTSTSAPVSNTLTQPQTPRDLTEVAVRLSAVESAIVNLAGKKVGASDIVPAVLSLLGSLFGVLVGGVITLKTQEKHLATQRSLAEQAAVGANKLADAKATLDRSLAESRAKLEIGNSFAQWQLKQLSELYGPLRALFQQSNSLYRHMNTVLVRADPERFRLRQGSVKDDFDSMVFEIHLNEEWVRFRTVVHIEEVYGRSYGIEDYFDEVVAIGARITKIIAEKAGYVRPDDPELLSVFGKYLAHFSVLERLHFHIKSKLVELERAEMSPSQEQETSVLHNIEVDVSAVFPQEIQKLVDDGFSSIHNELNTWRVNAAT